MTGLECVAWVLLFVVLCSLGVQNAAILRIQREMAENLEVINNNLGNVHHNVVLLCEDAVARTKEEGEDGQNN